MEGALGHLGGVDIGWTETQDVGHGDRLLDYRPERTRRVRRRSSSKRASPPAARAFSTPRSASGLELGFDERDKAEYLSYLFKTEHYQMVLKAGDMERVLPNLAWHLEEPRVGQSYPNYYAAQLASKFVKVVLSGTGGRCSACGRVDRPH